MSTTVSGLAGKVRMLADAGESNSGLVRGRSLYRLTTVPRNLSGSRHSTAALVSQVEHF
jgi:hypothetical protein